MGAVSSGVTSWGNRNPHVTDGVLVAAKTLSDAFLIPYNGQRHTTEYCTAPKTSAEGHLPLGFLVQQCPQLRDGLGGCYSSGKRSWQVPSTQQEAEGG